MKCPHCDVNLLMTDRQGVEIDYCPECRGVWLDRGELDKIVERSHIEMGGAPGSAAVATAPPRSDRSPGRDDRNRDDRRADERRSDDRYPPAKKKRSSFLEDIFDF